MSTVKTSTIEYVLWSHYHMCPGYLVGSVSVLLAEQSEDCENKIILLLSNSLPAAEEAVSAAKALMKTIRN